MYKEFSEWLEKVLAAGLPEKIVAVNFNLYEEVDYYWSMQLVGTASFEEEDEDWACDEVFSTGEDLYRWRQDTDWKLVLCEGVNMVREYLEKGTYSGVLKEYQAVGIGFVDGDIKVLYRNPG